MIRVGITGRHGFIGTHLFNTLGLYPDRFVRVEFRRDAFESDEVMDQFVSSCDVVVHLAGVNRHSDPEEIYQANIRLARKLVSALRRTQRQPHVIFSSSTQEEKDSVYGRSKKDARRLFEEWADESGAGFSGLIIPNVFGPFAKPFYNSVVATFCHQVASNQIPKIEIDAEIKLIYVNGLVKAIIDIITSSTPIRAYAVPHTAVFTVSNILAHIKRFKSQYSDSHIFPALNSQFETDLFNTYRSYEDIESKNPVLLRQHIDERGIFSEIVKLHLPGQVSFSTTCPGVTRGNHFHTRKIERFAVIKGNALIQLRRIGTNQVFDFYLSGDAPSFVDMPVWYAHNIKNIGSEELITLFWINEFYDPTDPDTFFEKV